MPPAAAEAEMLLSADQIRVGLAGNLAGYEFEAADGIVRRGDEIDYNGSPTGYTEDPQENIVYISAHDNETLFDISQYKHPLGTSTADRTRAQNLGIDITALAQGVNFFHAGVDMLRSKSLDRDSFNSGDWFNRLDFTFQENNWAVGLPVASKNQAEWPTMQPLLADPALAPVPADIAASVAHLQEILEIRGSSPLFSLETATEVQNRLAFYNTGPAQTQGLIVMSLSDEVGADLDPGRHEIVVLFNATDDLQSFAIPGAADKPFWLHPVQRFSADPVVRSSGFEEATGTFSVPARTTAVFVHSTTQAAFAEVLAELADLPVDDNHLDKAIGYVEEVLTSEWWLDGDTFDPAFKKTAFSELRKAVLELSKLKNLNPADQQVVDEAILRLTTEARLMAERALADAIAGLGDPREIAKAETEMVKAEEDLVAGREDKAIEHYGKACDHAIAALG
jgi:hypothetical protein